MFVNERPVLRYHRLKHGANTELQRVLRWRRRLAQVRPVDTIGSRNCCRCGKRVTRLANLASLRNVHIRLRMGKLTMLQAYKILFVDFIMPDHVQGRQLPCGETHDKDIVATVANGLVKANRCVAKFHRGASTLARTSSITSSAVRPSSSSLMAAGSLPHWRLLSVSDVARINR